MSVTWQLSKAMSELVQRHGVTLAAPAAVPLSPPTTGPMVLSGLAATLDTDIERVQFAPFAFDPLPASVLLMFDHTDQCAGRIEQLEHNDRGELVIQAYVDHPMARRCGAFSVSGDVERFTLHDTDKPSFYARVEKIRLREISLVPNPVQPRARVLQREPPSAASMYIAARLQHFDLSIAAIKLMIKQVRIIEEMAHADR